MGSVSPQSLSFIVPALNEAGNIEQACRGISRLAEEHLSDYEILVFDDGSTDRTGEIVRDLQKFNPHIVLCQNPITLGLGANYRNGVLKSRFSYAMMVPGDNEIVADSLKELFNRLGTADLLISYPSNPQTRPALRRFLSHLFVGFLNGLFNLQLRYYNGPTAIRTDLAKKYLPRTSGFAYMAVMVVQLIKDGCSYNESGFLLQGRISGRSKAFRLKNILSVIRDLWALFWKINLRQ